MLPLFNSPPFKIYICSVKRSDVTGNRFEWELGDNSYIRPPPPYFIVLASSVTTMDVKAIEFHRNKIISRYFKD